MGHLHCDSSHVQVPQMHARMVKWGSMALAGLAIVFREMIVVVVWHMLSVSTQPLRRTSRCRPDYYT